MEFIRDMIRYHDVKGGVEQNKYLLIKGVNKRAVSSKQNILKNTQSVAMQTRPSFLAKYMFGLGNYPSL